MLNGWNAYLKSWSRPTLPVQQRSVSVSDCVVVVELPGQSESLHFRAYAEAVGKGSLLDWVIQRLCSAFSDLSEIYVLAERAEAKRIEFALATDSGASQWCASGRGSLADLGSVMRTTRKRRVLLTDLTAALLPQEMFSQLLRHHTTSGNHATMLVGLPCTAAPVVVEAVLLSVLVRGGLPGLTAFALPQDVRPALAGLQRAVQASGRLARRVRLGRVAPISAQEQADRRWPYAVQLADPADIRVLRRVLEHCAVSAEHPEMAAEPLDRWTEVARDSQQAHLASLHPRPPGPRSHCSNARRVLYAQSPSAFSGVEQVLVLLAEGIAKGLAPPFEAVALIAQPGALTDRLAEAGVDVRIAQRDFSRGSVEYYLYSRRMLNDIRPAIVHAHTLAGLPFSCAVAESTVPFVQHVHVASEKAVRSLANQIMSASAVVAVSDFVRRRLVRLGLEPEKICVIHNGIRLAPATEASRAATNGASRVRTRQECGVPRDAPVVLMPARFAANKRHHVAIDAFARLRARLPNARMLLAGEALAGDRPVLHALESRIDRLRLTDRVHQLGFWRNMPALYAAADVLLLPSEDDPLPLTVLEGLAAGVPVVAARSGGTPEMIKHEVSGVLVEPGDVDGFATALAELLTDEERRASVIAGGLARCRAKFSLSRFVGRVGRLYERVLACEPVAAGDV